jgi:RNA polymerase sigma factor (sigma-70 family)
MHRQEPVTIEGVQAALEDWLRDRDEASLDRLVQAVYQFSKGIARRELLRVGGLKEGATEILHEGIERLMTRLRSEDFVNRHFFERHPPPTARDLINFVAQLIRCEVCDLLRKLARPAEGALSLDAVRDDDSEAPAGAVEPSQRTYDPARLLAWAEFHQQVKELPDRFREVFERKYYFERSTPQVAGELGIAERTVRKYYAKALELLEPHCVRI